MNDNYTTNKRQSVNVPEYYILIFIIPNTNNIIFI